MSIKKFEVSSVEDVEKIIETELPEGLAHYRKAGWMGSETGAYIGFNLSRFAYTNRLAAECHAMRDLLRGVVGHSYGLPFKPHVVEHKATEDRPAYYEVYTN